MEVSYKYTHHLEQLKNADNTVYMQLFLSYYCNSADCYISNIFTINCHFISQTQAK